MAMGKRKRDQQPPTWVTMTNSPTAASHPFYRRLNQLLREHGFDDFAEAQCATFYAETMGRPSLPPGIYFRLLLIGYFNAVYANRRRIRGDRGKRLLRKRGELLERPCAHLYETGGLRRAHVRRHENVLKRLLVHASAFNLGLWMRTLCGIGTPRGLQGRVAALTAVLTTLSNFVCAPIAPIWSQIDRPTPSMRQRCSRSMSAEAGQSFQSSLPDTSNGKCHLLLAIAMTIER